MDLKADLLQVRAGRKACPEAMQPVVLVKLVAPALLVACREAPAAMQPVVLVACREPPVELGLAELSLVGPPLTRVPVMKPKRRSWN